MAESHEENMEIPDAQKQEAESVKTQANEFFKGFFLYFVLLLKCLRNMCLV